MSPIFFFLAVFYFPKSHKINSEHLHIFNMKLCYENKLYMYTYRGPIRDRISSQLHTAVGAKK